MPVRAHMAAASLLLALSWPLNASASEQQKTTPCVSERQISTMKVVDATTLIFQGRQRNKVWVNRPSSACKGAKLDDRVIAVKYMAGRYCQGDLVEIIKKQTEIRAGTCSLGVFERIDRAMADKLEKDAKAAQISASS